MRGCDEKGARLGLGRPAIVAPTRAAAAPRAAADVATETPARAAAIIVRADPMTFRIKLKYYWELQSGLGVRAAELCMRTAYPVRSAWEPDRARWSKKNNAEKMLCGWTVIIDRLE